MNPDTLDFFAYFLEYSMSYYFWIMLWMKNVNNFQKTRV